MKFKVIAGTHRDESNLEYKMGEVIETELPLTDLFPNKFEALPEVVVTPKAKNEVVTPEKEETSVEKESKGDDVTADFPLAAEKECSVFKSSKGYTVYDEVEDKALTEKPVRTKTAVTKLLKALTD